MFWSCVRRLDAYLSGLALVSVPLLGFGLVKYWSFWTSALMGSRALVDDGASSLVKTAVEMAVALAATLAPGRAYPLYRRGAVFIGAVAGLEAGAALLAFSPWQAGATLGEALSYAGFVATLALWYELYGRLSATKAALAFSGSCVVAALADALVSGAGAASAAALLGFFPLAAACLLARSHLRLEKDAGERQPGSRADAGEGGEDADGTGAPLRGPAVESPRGLLRASWRLLVWVALFSLVRGIDESAVGVLTPVGSVGKLVPDACIVVGILFFSSRGFDLALIYRVGMPVMVIALAGLYLAPGEALPEFLIGLGGECYRTLAYIAAFAIARRSGLSAARICMAVFMTHVLFTDAGQLVFGWARAAMPADGALRLASLGAVAALLFIASLIFRETDLYGWGGPQRGSAPEAEAATMPGDESPGTPPALDMQSVEEEAGLSPRERSVLELLLGGMTYAQIGEELFISPGTVRVHASNIYRKLDVHGRDELVAKLRGTIPG